MALCASSDNIPEVGDTVKALQLSDDGEVLWTFFNSGKVLYTHISDIVGRSYNLLNLIHTHQNFKGWGTILLFSILN